MMNNWEEYDKFTEADLKGCVDDGMLPAQLTVLLKKKLIGYVTPIEEVQLILLARYDVEYDASIIEAELTDIQYFNSLQESYEIEEDF